MAPFSTAYTMLSAAGAVALGAAEMPVTRSLGLRDRNVVDQQRGASCEIDRVERRRRARRGQDCERGIGADDLEAVHCRGIDAERSDVVQFAVVRRVLREQPIGLCVDHVQRRRCGAGKVVRVRSRRHGDRAAAQRRIGGRGASVRIGAQVLLRVADDAQPVRHRIEIHAERSAAQRREGIRRVSGVGAQHSCHRRCAVARIEQVEAGGICDRVEPAVRRTQVEADDRFAALQTAHRDVRVERSRCRGLEGHQAVVRRQAEQRRTRIRIQRQAAHALAAADRVDARQRTAREIDRVQFGGRRAGKCDGREGGVVRRR